MRVLGINAIFHGQVRRAAAEKEWFSRREHGDATANCAAKFGVFAAARESSYP